MRKLILVCIIIAVTALLIFYPKEKSPESFKQVFDDMIRTANHKDIDGFMDYFSTNYKDSSGINHLLLKKIIEDYFNQFDSFEVAYENLNVEKGNNPEGEDVKEVDMDLIVTGVKNGVLAQEIIGRSGHLRSITAVFEKSGSGKWKIKEVKGFDEPLY